MSDTNPALRQSEILRRHSLYQRSYTGETPSTTRTTSPVIQRQTKIRRSNESRKHSPPKKKERAKSLDYTSFKTNFNSPHEMLDYRRKHRTGRTRPWAEKSPEVPKLKYGVKIFYDKTLPIGVDESKVTMSSRKYVSNSKYGNIYKIQQDKPKKKEEKSPPQKWLWEDEYMIWLNGTREKYLENNTKRVKPAKLGLVGISGDMTSQTSRKESLPVIKESTKDHRPTADVYASYHYHRLEKGKKKEAALVIQRFFKGWFVRSFLRKLKKKALLQHGRLWPNFVQDYRELVTRIQTRYGIMKPSCRLDFREVKQYMDRKTAYEKAFVLTAKAGKLHRDDLIEFFNRCDLWPTQGDITRAFDTIYRGSRNTAEVVFVLDCSTNAGVVGFHNLIFVKDIVINLDIAPDRTRVGVVPYNDDVFNSFGITTFDNKQDILSAIGKIRFKHGLTRTDMALKLMRDMFKNARPGVQKIGIVVADSQSSDPESTRREAKISRDQGIQIIAISVGTDCLEELKAIASSAEHVYKALDAKALLSIKQKIEERFCIDHNQGNTYIPPSTAYKTHQTEKSRPLEMSEALEVVFMCYPPTACDLEGRGYSRWIRPIINNKEAWSLIDDNIIRATGMKACLRLVIQSRLSRYGYITVPSDIRNDVEKVTSETEAMKIIEKFIGDRMTLTIDKDLKTIADLKIENDSSTNRK